MKVSLLAVAAVAACLPILASAQFAKTEDAIKYRQSALFVMGQHFGRIGAMVNDRAPFDAAAAKQNAGYVATLAALPWTAFGPGTDKGGNTRALPVIWAESAKFTTAQQKFVDSTKGLVAAAETGDKAKLKEAFNGVGATCKGCHDDFRGK